LFGTMFTMFQIPWGTAGTGELTVFCAVSLAGILAPGRLFYINATFPIWLRRGKQPQMSKVRRALQQLAARPVAQSKDWREILGCIQTVQRDQDLPEMLALRLRSNRWEERFGAKFALAGIGSGAIDALLEASKAGDCKIRGSVAEVLRSIDHDARRILDNGATDMLCARCLVRCVIRPSGGSDGSDLLYYGCPECGQSGELISGRTELVAVLDRTMLHDCSAVGVELRVNWLIQRSIFDFDKVRIIHTSEEEVRRFLRQVARHRDRFSTATRKTIQCVVGSGLELSPETIQMLQEHFGDVQIVDDESSQDKT
jgi:hypothetical protein